MSVKLYSHYEDGTIIAASFNRSEQDYRCLDKYCRVSHFSKQHFEHIYEPLPETLKVRSAEWAVQMLNKGKKLVNPTEVHGDYIYLYLGEVLFADGWKFRDFQNYLFDGKHGFELYEEPKSIIEKLPHEFEKGEEVLVRGETADEKEWFKTTFSDYKPYRQYVFGVDSESIFKKLYWPYCLPYAGNEHLEGTVTEGEHGKVPDGYIPPHTPKLEDDDYWMIGDRVIDLATLRSFTISDVTDIHVEGIDYRGDKETYRKNGAIHRRGLRTLYHERSYVDDNGTVHEHIPTRPHKIDKE